MQAGPVLQFMGFSNKHVVWYQAERLTAIGQTSCLRSRVRKFVTVSLAGIYAVIAQVSREEISWGCIDKSNEGDEGNDRGRKLHFAMDEGIVGLIDCMEDVG